MKSFQLLCQLNNINKRALSSVMRNDGLRVRLSRASKELDHDDPRGLQAQRFRSAVQSMPKEILLPVRCDSNTTSSAVL